MADRHQRPASPDERAAEGVAAPTHAERCRTLVHRARAATLSTLAREPEGVPYGSLVTLGSDATGRPLLLLSSLAEHTRNLRVRAEASVLVTEPLDAHDEPLAVGRVTILGTCAPVAPEGVGAAREAFLAKQPRSSYYIDFDDFALYRLEPASLRYVGGFGRMSWVSADDYRAAASDPLAESAEGVIEHMNADHAGAVLAYARALAGVSTATAATMTAVDRYGFELAAATPEGPRALRIAFDAPVATPEEVRRAMIELLARARGN